MRSVMILFLLYSMFSCKEPERVDDKDTTTNVTPDPLKEKVYIMNEGNFTWGNSSVTLYLPDDNIIYEDNFKRLNNRDLGDIAQSMTFVGDLGYIVVNNSGRIEVVQLPAMQSIGTISGLTSPRYLVPVSSSKAYVSDFKSGGISIVNLLTRSVTGAVSCPGWTEEMAFVSDKVFVTNLYSRYVYVINPASDKLVDSIEVGYASSGIVMDNQSKLWVLCTGDSVKNEDAYLVRIDPVSNSKLVSFLIPGSRGVPMRLKVNGAGDKLYYLNNGLYSMRISDQSLPSSPFIGSQGNYWGLGVSPYNGDIYISNAKDYVQKGEVLRYKSDGTFIRSIPVGIIPGNIYYYK